MNSPRYDAVSFSTERAAWTTWSKPGADGRVKTFYSNGKRLRLLELPPGFDEEKWCLVGHQGYVFEGRFTIIFEDGTFDCQPGDAFSIPDGVRHRSRGSMDGPTRVFVVDNHQS
ncbi:cupin domain-containing protein [Achromobacter spanius]|uniref:Cupin domain-containing protein n=1 Tax=Achromobacter spanius TaxID=217203 RepID=A0ABY8GMD2_9BURK|nr:cupin domain-containing protein [Achromobacter spanius]WAI84921.1 cupin domain-containing protein [Achromobacter spanius]WFP05827.1 cupin domain-containing protein [Achromobacter spanius]